MTTYRDELRRAMEMVAAHPRAVFLGQSVVAGGTAMSGTLAGVPAEQRIEMPVFENTQMGISVGLALAGWLPVSVYPRINFLLEATGQLVQHLDALPAMGFTPRVLVRTAVAHGYPLDPGPQHLGDYSAALRALLRTVKVVRLTRADEVVPAYQRAAERPGATVLVEYAALYDQEVT